MIENAENDSLFPPGKWNGFYLEKRPQYRVGKHCQEMFLSFKDGHISGEGRDDMDRFSISGSYSTETGECNFTKWYDCGWFDRNGAPVSYRGFNQGRFIWGTWNISTRDERAAGGFKIWPDGYPEGDVDAASKEIEMPLVVDQSRRLELVQV